MAHQSRFYFLDTPARDLHRPAESAYHVLMDGIHGTSTDVIVWMVAKDFPPRLFDQRNEVPATDLTAGHRYLTLVTAEVSQQGASGEYSIWEGSVERVALRARYRPPQSVTTQHHAVFVHTAVTAEALRLRGRRTSSAGSRPQAFLRFRSLSSVRSISARGVGRPGLPGGAARVTSSSIVDPVQQWHAARGGRAGGVQ